MHRTNLANAIPADKRRQPAALLRRASMKLKSTTQRLGSRALFTIVGGVVVINPAFAQEPANRRREPASEELEEVVVTGLRGSLKASMETKRDAIGVVDAINAEDIGKFPDTNLAESLQRITGVSIDRRNGEGALVRRAASGPQFNLVTLNGRQMPAPTPSATASRTIGGAGPGTSLLQLRQPVVRSGQCRRGLQDEPR